MRRSSNLSAKLAAAVALAAASGAASAAAPTLKEVLDASGITVNGYVSASYNYSDGQNAFHNYDISREGFQVDQAGLQVGYLPSEGFGAFVNVIAGEDARVQNGVEFSRDSNGAPDPTGAPTNPNDNDDAINLTQAYIQYAGGGYTAIAGKYVTLVGSEVIDPRGNFNFSRSLLFFFEPSTHTGVRVTVPVSDTFQFILGVNNGFNVTSSSFSSKLGEVGIVYSPSDSFTLTAQGYFGKDPNPSVGGFQRQFANFVATWNATDDLTLVLTADYQSQDLPPGVTANSGEDKAKALGVAAYVNYKLSDQWRVAVRGEYFDDQEGFFTSAGLGVLTNTQPDQTVSDLTVTLGYAPAENYELRTEVRYDMTSDDILIDKDGDITDNQVQVAFQALYKF